MKNKEFIKKSIFFSLIAFLVVLVIYGFNTKYLYKHDTELRKIMEQSLTKFLKYPDNFNLVNVDYEYKKIFHDNEINMEDKNEIEYASLCGQYSAQNGMGVYSSPQPFFAEVLVFNKSKTIMGQAWMQFDRDIKKQTSIGGTEFFSIDKDEFKQKYDLQCGKKPSNLTELFNDNNKYQVLPYTLSSDLQGYDIDTMLGPEIEYYLETLNALAKHPDIKNTLSSCINSFSPSRFNPYRACLKLASCDLETDFSDYKWVNQQADFNSHLPPFSEVSIEKIILVEELNQFCHLKKQIFSDKNKNDSYESNFEKVYDESKKKDIRKNFFNDYSNSIGNLVLFISTKFHELLVDHDKKIDRLSIREKVNTPMLIAGKYISTIKNKFKPDTSFKNLNLVLFGVDYIDNFPFYVTDSKNITFRPNEDIGRISLSDHPPHYPGLCGQVLTVDNTEHKSFFAYFGSVFFYDDPEGVIKTLKNSSFSQYYSENKWNSEAEKFAFNDLIESICKFKEAE